MKALFALAGLALVAASCGSSDPESGLTLPSSTDESATAEDTDDSGPDTTLTGAGAEEDPVDSTDSTESNDSPSEPVSGQVFADMDEDAQRELLFGLVEEAHDAYFACVTDPKACDFESDFAHLTSGPYKMETERVYRWMLDEGLRARVPETDELYYVGFLAQDVTPFQAIVRVCFTDTGEIYRPADGGEEEIVNADAVASKVDYLVLEDPEGNLKVDDEDRLERSEDLTLCDEYS
jgi:hypothetical protein